MYMSSMPADDCLPSLGVIYRRLPPALEANILVILFFSIVPSSLHIEIWSPTATDPAKILPIASRPT